MILKYDSPAFLSALNEAFEDSFLNDSPGEADERAEQRPSRRTDLRPDG